MVMYEPPPPELAPGLPLPAAAEGGMAELPPVEVLAPAVRAYSEADPGSPAQARAFTVVEHALRTQLEPTWNLMWHGIDRLRD